MAATTNVIPGIDFLLKSGANAIGGGLDATLTLQQDLTDTTNKGGANWAANLPSTRRWSLAFGTLWLESSAEIAGSTMDVTVGGTSIKGMTTATLTLECAFREVVNSSTGLARVISPNVRRASLEIAGDYYDPAGTGADALSDLLGEITGATSAGLAVVCTFGSGGSFTFTGRPATATVGAPNADIVQNSVTLNSTGAITNGTTGSDTGLAALLSAYFAASQATAVTALFGTATATNTEFTGSAFVERLAIQLPFTGRVEVSGSLQGSGAVTQQATGS